MSNILGNMPPVFGSGYRGVVPAPSAADVSAQNILRADGTWGAGPSGTLPSQTGNAGTLLTTDGTNASWASSLNTFQFGDVTLGTSGPSVKSTLSARAPRQGLVFDGTAGVTGTAVTIGTADLTFSQWIRVPSTVSATRGLFLFSPAGSIGATSLLGYLDSDATLNIHITGATSGDRTKQTLSGFVTSYAGKWVNILFTRVGSTWTGYINGVATTFSASTSGTAPTWAGSISGAVVNFGSLGSSGAIYNDAISAINLYNRALSASEVVSLYESGAPAGADYNSASNTALNIATFANSNIYPYGTFSGASTTGFTAVSNGTGFQAAFANTSITFKTGTKYRLTYTLTLNSGAAPFFVLGNPGVAGYSTPVQLSAGTNSVEVTATGSATSAQGFGFQHNSSAGNYSISNISLVPVGLLLAPDAAQAGGGLTWYDTSGNAANITLPASGVSWNVPTSGKTASGWNYTGQINTTKSGATTGAPTNMGVFVGSVVSGSTDGIGIGDNGASSYKLIQSYSGALALNPGGNNVWIGKSIDSGNGLLQLAENTARTAGIGFGPDIALYRAGGNTLKLELGVSAAALWFDNGGNGTGGARILGSSGALTITSNGANSLYLQTGGSAALTLDNSQNATFAGDVTVSGGNLGVGSTATSIRSIICGGTLSGGATQNGIYIGSAAGTDATSEYSGITIQPTASAGSYTIGSGYGISIATPSIGTSAAITTQRGLFISNQGVSGKTTNAYGIDIAAQSGAATTNVAIRAAGKIMFTSLPTSSVGLASGELWNDSGTVKIA